MIDKATADAFIQKISALGTKPGLDRVKTLLNRLGNPEKRIKVIHVAGTNGKGSVCAMLQFALMECGYKVGKFSSPCVFSEFEMYSINGEELDEIEYLGFLSNIIDVTKDLFEDELPTLFEVQVAIALLFFESNHVDFAIVEAGMGGLLDATNVFDEVLCSVITSIGMDHVGILGDTIGEIATQKAGILKKNCYGISIKQEDEANNALMEYAKEIGAKFEFVDYHHVKYIMNRNTVTCREFKNVKVPFFGDFQYDNTTLALETLHILRYQGVNIDVDKASKGVSNAYLPGRMEKVNSEPLIFIDGCHNKPAALRIKETIDNHFSDKSITFIMGVLKDKEVSKILQTLLPLGNAVVTVTPDNPRAMSASLLANDCFLYDIEVTIADDFDDAVRKALDYNNDIIIALGSLSYLRDIKASFKQMVNAND